jgi:hypothetical protein
MNEINRVTQVQFTAMPKSPQRFTSWPEACYVCKLETFSETESVRKAINEASYREPNWDGFDALPISNEIRGNAVAALNTLARNTHAPAVVPNPNGTFSFEWETDYGFAHLEIGKTRYSFYVKPNIGRPIFSDGHAAKVAGFLGALVDGVLYPKPSEPAFVKPEILAANV